MNQPTVLVTGSSSGIGKATTLQLAKLGFKVFAGVRDLEKVKFDSPNITPIQLDITKMVDIQSVKRALADQNLVAIVNNAGVADFHPVELVPEDKLRQVFDVNFFGPVMLIQTLLPTLRKTKGRIINIGSFGGHTTTPFGFAVCASKHAVKSLTDSLRMELEQDHIHVIEIDPLSIATPASAKALEQVSKITQTFSDKGKQRYQKPMLLMGEAMQHAETTGMPPEGVAKVVAKAITSNNPKSFYSVGPNASRMTFLSKLMSPKAFDKLKLKLFGIKVNK